MEMIVCYVFGNFVKKLTKMKKPTSIAAIDSTDLVPFTDVFQGQI